MHRTAMRRSAFAFFTLFTITFVAGENVSAQSAPAFSTQTPNSGVLGNAFVVLLPIFNTGSAEADSVQVTSVTLGHAALASPALPVSVGTLLPADHYEIHLQFDATNLVIGQNYLISVRGTYSAGTQTFGFAVNRILNISIAVGPVQTELRRWVVLDAIKAKFPSLSNLDPTTANEQILGFLQTFPDFVESGISPDLTSVWATFADGLPLIIANDFAVPAGSSKVAMSGTSNPERVVAASSLVHMASPVLSAANLNPPVELPRSSAVRLLTAMGTGWDATELISDLSSWFRSNGYQPVRGVDASVNSLMNTVGGDGVFYIFSHGGYHAGKGVFSVYTSTVADSTNDNLFKQDLEPDPPLQRTLFIMYALKDADPEKMEFHYSFNAHFVETHFKNFSANSFVFFNTCHSNEQFSSDFRQAIFAKNASLYAGWSGSPLGSVDTSRLVFDRLLGADQFCPEDGASQCSDGPAQPPVFAQRPFNWVSVITDLPLHHLGFDPPYEGHPKGSMIGFVPAASGAFGLLAPSISNMSVDETKGQGQLTINGIFGQDPRSVAGGSEADGVVTVGGPNSPVTVESWDANKIVVDLASSGPGSSGDVQVVVRQHKSNVARLTQWQGTFQAVWAGNGSLKQTINFEPAFRLDIREYRPVIHNPPVEPGSIVPIFFFPISSPVSTGSFACTGEGIYTNIPGEIDTFTWTGSGSLPLLQAGSSFPPPVFFGALGILMSHTAMSFSASAGGTTTGPCSFSEHVMFLPPNCDPSVQSCEGDTSGKFPLLCSALPATKLTLDPDTAAIEGNSLPLGNLPCFVNQPGPATVSWNMIDPLSDTAPDPLSAR